ncbi:hypothetical protein ACWDSF_09130 [Nocardia beijingensis]
MSASIGSAHSVLMWIGAVTALAPLVLPMTIRKPGAVARPRVAVAHVGMAACMALLAVGAGTGWAELSVTAIAFGCAFTVAPACPADSAAVHCVIDLLAMAWIVQSSAPVGPEDAAGPHHHGGAPGGATVLGYVPLLVWVGAAVIAACTSSGAAIRRPMTERAGLPASLAMAATMTPMLA